MSRKSQNSEVTVTVVVPTREVVEAYNRFDTMMDVPCPACGEEWRFGVSPLDGHRGWELMHHPDCAYQMWLGADCPTPEGIIPA